MNSSLNNRIKLIIIKFLNRKIWYSYRFFKIRGLKSPKHEFFYGNFRQIIKNKNYSEVLKKWTEELGKTYGYFEGHLPIIVTSDLNIIQEVFIKQASNFMARKVFNLNIFLFIFFIRKKIFTFNFRNLI